MQRRCAQPMHENPSTASIETTISAHARDTGEFPSSGTRKTTCSCHQYLSRAACWLRWKAPALHTKWEPRSSGTQSLCSSSAPQCVLPTRLSSRYSKQCAHQAVGNSAVLSGKHCSTQSAVLNSLQAPVLNGLTNRIAEAPSMRWLPG